MSDRICLLEDDRTISRLVGEKLRARGYAVEAFTNAETLLQRPRLSEGWDLFVVDILLEGSATGLQVCERLRAESSTLPILILSALSEPLHRIEGLKRGADDYLPKPFEMEELLLRVDGMLKRRAWYRQELPEGERFKWGPNSVDFVRLEAVTRTGKASLTQKECMLMKLLVEKQGQVVSRDEILDQVWGYNDYPSSRTVDNFIVRLRKLFEDEPSRPRYIHSVRGLGYKFTPRDT